MDTVTFHASYEAHAGDVFRLARFLTGSDAQAADVTSETFLRAWAGRRAIREVTAKGYLLAIARNLALDERRRGRRWAAQDPPDTTVSPDAPARLELRRAVAAIDRLPPRYREPLLLAAAGVPYDEIARGLGISPPVAKIRIFRARRALERVLEGTERNAK